MPYLSVNKVLALLIDGNFWISSATVVLYLSAAKVFAIEQTSLAMAIFLFCGTWFVYGLHSVLTQKYYAKYNQLLIWLAMPPALIAFLFLPSKSQLAFVFPMLISVAYILPLFQNNKKLRDFPLIKIFLVAGAWTALSTTIPVFSMLSESGIQLWTFSAARFLLIFAITLPFDIRDIQKDSISGVKTLPMVFGVGGSKILALVCLSSSGLLTIFHYFTGWHSGWLLIAETLSLILASVLVSLSEPDRHPWFFTGLLDGVMIFQATLLLMLG